MPKGPIAEVGGRRRVRNGFTLVETLVVVAILAILMSMLIPALRSARSQMKSLMCVSNLKSISLHFTLFAENRSEFGKGNSAILGHSRFWIDDFQASQYRTGEFWDDPDRSRVAMSNRDELMMCPAGPDALIKIKDQPFGKHAFSPTSNVSIGMNARLAQGVTKGENGQLVLASKLNTTVDSGVLNHPYVPLVFDVDGDEAVSRGVSPFYAAPPLDDGDQDPYADGERWNPSFRHRGGTNVAFVGGHVQSSERPARESWDWKYQARVRPGDSSPQ